MSRQPLLRMRTMMDSKARDKIQASKLVDRLQDYVMADDFDDPDELVKGKKKSEKNRKRMSPGQVSAALGLIKKAIPDLAAVQLSGDEDAPVVVREIRRTIVDPKSHEE